MNEARASNAEGADAGLGEFLGRSRRAWLHDAIRNGMRDSPSANEVMDAMHGSEAPPPSDGAGRAGMEGLTVNVIDAATVTIWLSAGPQDAQGRSCDMDNTENCQLYKVIWNLATHVGSASVALDLTGIGLAVVQPAVDRTGRRLAAVLSQGWGTGGDFADATALMAWIPHGMFLPVDLQTQGAFRPEKPTWLGATNVLWGGNAQGNQDDDWWGNLHIAQVERSGASERVLLGGADGTNVPKGTAPCVTTNVWPSGDCVSWRDPDVYEDPPGHAAGAWVTVFGRHGTAAQLPTADSQPVVASLPSATTIEQFDLGTGRDGQEIESCHHPAWNVSGSEILCTRQFDEDQTSIPGLYVRALYGYRFDGSEWTGAHEVVESRDIRGDVNVRAFDAAPRGPLPQALPADALITYKFGHWCGSDRFVVATVFAQAKDPEPVLQSRVLLFDTRSPQEMWDLTDLVEALKGVPRGTWRAMFSACIEAS